MSSPALGVLGIALNAFCFYVQIGIKFGFKLAVYYKNEATGDRMCDVSFHRNYFKLKVNH